MLGISFTPRRLFKKGIKWSNALLNALAHPAATLTGTLATSQITDGAVTPAKASNGAWFYGTDSGTSVAHAVTLSPTISSYTEGLILRYQVNAVQATSLASVTITSSSNQATVTYTSHGLAVGDRVFISGANEEEYNGCFLVESVPGVNTFTYKFASSTSPATGTIWCQHFPSGGVTSYAGGVTLNVDGVGAKDIRYPGGGKLQGQDFENESEIEVIYNAAEDYFELLNRDHQRFAWWAIDTSTSVNAYNVTLDPTGSAAAARPAMVVFKATLSNTSSCTLNTGFGAKTIKKNKSSNLVSGDIVAGQWVTVVWDGTAWQLQNPPAQTQVEQVPVSRGLAVALNSTNPTYQIDVTADSLLVTNTNGLGRYLTSVSVTADITDSGANGVDTGGESDDHWYVYVIYNGSTDTTASLLSTDDASPTLPSGYTHFALVGYVRNDTDFKQTAVRRGDQWEFTSDDATVSGSQETFTWSHPFGVVPRQFRVVLVMGSSTELGYSEGDEVDNGLVDSSELRALIPVGSSTELKVLKISSELRVPHKTTYTGTGIDESKWTAKAYATF